MLKKCGAPEKKSQMGQKEIFRQKQRHRYRETETQRNREQRHRRFRRWKELFEGGEEGERSLKGVIPISQHAAALFCDEDCRSSINRDKLFFSLWTDIGAYLLLFEVCCW